MAQYTDNITLLNAVTAAGANTSNAVDVSMREQISLVFTCANHSAGNGVFTVDASNDGTNWVTGIAMQDATSTASTTYITSKTLNSNTSAAVYLPFFPFRFIRAVCTVTIDGTYTVVLEGQS